MNTAASPSGSTARSTGLSPGNFRAAGASDVTAAPPTVDHRARLMAGTSGTGTLSARSNVFRRSHPARLGALLWLALCTACTSAALAAPPGDAGANAAAAPGPPTQAQPPCPGNADGPVGNAGCLAVSEGRLLVIEQSNGRWSIPGGTSKPGEAARCTAYRETLEETGIALRVGELLQVFANGFHVFQCEPVAGATPQVRWSNLEVRRALWLPPDEIPINRWRYPGQLCALLQLTDPLPTETACR